MSDKLPTIYKTKADKKRLMQKLIKDWSVGSGLGVRYVAKMAQDFYTLGVSVETGVAIQEDTTGFITPVNKLTDRDTRDLAKHLENI